MSRTTLALLLALFVTPVLPACAVSTGQDGDDETVQSEDEITRTGRFETFQGKDGQFYFHLLAGNGEKVLVSEGYTTGGAAAAGVSSVKSNGVEATRYEIRTAVSGEFYFVLKAGNGAIVGTSEMYVTKANAERAVASVVKVVVGTVTVAAAPVGDAKFQVFKGLDGKYYFHVRAKNGEIVLQSQGYTTRASAVSGEAAVRANGTDSRHFSLAEAANGEFYFVLKASNGQVIARGETYSSRWNAERGISSIVELLAGTVGAAS